jgi:hypothetical protein
MDAALASHLRIRGIVNLPAVRIFNRDAYIVDVWTNPARATREQQSPARSLAREEWSIPQ